MNEESKLRRVLTQAVPAPSLNPARASAAISRARRRRTTRASAWGIVAVLVAVGAPFATRALVETGTKTQDLAASLRCPSVPPDDDPRTELGLPVIRGAVAVELCGFPLGVGAPTGILREGADGIARQILELPVVRENWDMICFPRRDTPRAVVFAYPDGSLRTTFLTTCDGSGFQVGGENRGSYVDVRNVFANFRELLQHQGGPGSPQPSPPIELQCSDRPHTAVTSVPVLVDGILCETLRVPIRRNLAAVPLSAADLSVLAAEIRERVERYGSVGRQCGGTRPDFVIVARDAQGITYRLDTCAAYPFSQGAVRQAPSAESQTILDRVARDWPE